MTRNSQRIMDAADQIRQKVQSGASIDEISDLAWSLNEHNSDDAVDCLAYLVLQTVSVPEAA